MCPVCTLFHLALYLQVLRPVPMIMIWSVSLRTKANLANRAQYANIAAVSGRVGPHGLSTVYVDDVREFYEKEDLPTAYKRRELPYFSTEANDHIDRMSHHVGFQIVRPFPQGDGFGKWADVEAEKAKYK